MHCSERHSKNYVKNGFNSANHQMYRCKMCGRQFVLNPVKSRIPGETKELIDRLLLERTSLAGIVRVTGVSERWLQSNNKQWVWFAINRDTRKIVGIFIGDRSAQSALGLIAPSLSPMCYYHLYGFLRSVS